MAAVKIVLNNGKKFDSKKKCNDYFSHILSKSKLNKKVVDKYHDDVLNLFKRHPKYNILKAIGINYIYVSKDIFNYRCFHVSLSNGISDSFGINKCINSKNEDQFTKFHAAAREAIKDQIYEFRSLNKKHDNYFISEISHKKIKPNETHIDHEYEFVNIVIDFINKFNIDIDTITFDENIPMITRFTDTKIEKDFYDYHKQKATLRVVSKNENLTRKRGTIKKWTGIQKMEIGDNYARMRRRLEK